MPSRRLIYIKFVNALFAFLDLLGVGSSIMLREESRLRELPKEISEAAESWSGRCSSSFFVKYSAIMLTPWSVPWPDPWPEDFEAMFPRFRKPGEGVSDDSALANLGKRRGELKRSEL
mmetsp:Transcript_23854/g.34285  ORF Transcript_23854/g.34285 Transcript_23854/m.34285 type:complete len:118 (+) Transcript_23854:1041-1394(+)